MEATLEDGKITPGSNASKFSKKTKYQIKKLRDMIVRTSRDEILLAKLTKRMKNRKSM